MNLAFTAPLPIEHHARRARVAAAAAHAASRLPQGWQRGTAMTRKWLASRRTQVLLILAFVAVERTVAHVLHIELLAGLATGSGLLLVWGIGHCDTMDGPLVMLANKALAENNVNLILPWVHSEDEGEIRHAFEHAQVVRALGPEARSLADRHFLETLVRIHRAGEGAPFTGLKPAGLDLGPAVPAADRALKLGSADAVVKLLVDAVSAGVHARFHEAAEKQHFNPNDVAAGRQYVEAYVPYIHYVERLWEVAKGAAHGYPVEHGAQAHQSEHPGQHH